MALINDPDNLSQGAPTTSTGVSFGTPTGRQLAITSAATLPAISAGDYFAVRNSPDTQNNGLWLETGGTPTTSSITATKVTGPNPIAGGPDTINFRGTTATKLNIHYDVATREISLIEQNGLSEDGVLGQTVYSKAMIDWKDDAYLIANGPFPMLMIDADAGKAIIGQDASGNNNGWNWFDSVTYSVQTRKLVRNLGWTEVDSSGNILAIWPSIITLGSFENEAADTAYYQFGNDTTVNDSVNFDFPGPVNEAVQAFERLANGSINGGTGVAISADGRTLTRSDGGNWSTSGADGFKVGGRILLRNAENTTSNGNPNKVFGGGAFLLSVVGQGVNGVITAGTAAVATPNGFDFVDGGGGNDQIVRNDGLSWLVEGYFVGGVVVTANATIGGNNGTRTILAVTADTIDVATASLTADTDDNTATFGPFSATGSPDTAMNAAIDNRNEITARLRVRDGDVNGKTFGQANLATAGKAAAGLGGLVFSFPLANVTDLKITETDANIDANPPYTGMTLTVYSTPQSLGGAGPNALVGGPYNFGFVIDANDGTDIQVFEWIQRQLRKTTDIDNDAGVVIGRTLDGLARFLGDALEAGSVDGGLTFPRNPQGGGSGVMILDLNSASRNSTRLFDNLGVQRGFPIGTIVTLDFNQTLIDDTVAAYTLYYDRTIRTTVSDLVVNAGGTITSAGSNLPGSLDAGVGAYIRLSGFTGAEAPANGIYQVTSISTSSYTVVRYDGDPMITTASAAIPLDQHPIDSPDAIIVDSNVPADVTGLATADFTFTYDYSNNVQGGKAGGVDAFVVARAIGQQTAQFAQSTVQTIQSGIALTIPVSANIERNFLNP
jgi:hypothetical protein